MLHLRARQPFNLTLTTRCQLKLGQPAATCNPQNAETGLSGRGKKWNETEPNSASAEEATDCTAVTKRNSTKVDFPP